MTPRYTWTPASEPPEDHRWVLGWRSDGVFCIVMRSWGNSGSTWWITPTGHYENITHWRDVEPPEVTP